VKETEEVDTRAKARDKERLARQEPSEKKPYENHL
jgi:hypothetical protein